MATPAGGTAGPAQFPTTSWSIIRNAGDPASPEYQSHLRRLIERYWRPVYHAIRRGWRKSDSDAKDLTQEFFASVVLEGAMSSAFEPGRGSFRVFLRASIVNFMRNVVRDSGRQKRGGDALFFSLDDADEGEIAETAPLTPEDAFDAAWSRAVMSQAMVLLEERLVSEGKSSVLAAFKRYDLHDETRRPSYNEVGEELGLSAPQVMHALRQAREAYRQVVTGIVAEYVDGPEQIAREIRALFER